MKENQKEADPNTIAPAEESCYAKQAIKVLKDYAKNSLLIDDMKQ